VGAVNNRASSMDISKDWKVTFEGNGSTMMDHLRSWTDDEATRYFSGTATYEKSIEMNPSMLREGLRVQLDFGAGEALPEQPIKAGMQVWFDPPVREAAVVYLNDRRVGSVWCQFFSLQQ
jgi:hypothetical protein